MGTVHNQRLTRVKVSTWPFMQPPTIIFGSEGQNSKAKMSSGHSSNNCKQHRKTHTHRAEIYFKVDIYTYWVLTIPSIYLF